MTVLAAVVDVEVLVVVLLVVELVLVDELALVEVLVVVPAYRYLDKFNIRYDRPTGMHWE